MAVAIGEMFICSKMEPNLSVFHDIFKDTESNVGPVTDS